MSISLSYYLHTTQGVYDAKDADAGLYIAVIILLSVLDFLLDFGVIYYRTYSIRIRTPCIMQFTKLNKEIYPREPLRWVRATGDRLMLLSLTNEHVLPARIDCVLLQRFHGDERLMSATSLAEQVRQSCSLNMTFLSKCHICHKYCHVSSQILQRALTGTVHPLHSYYG